MSSTETIVTTRRKLLSELVSDMAHAKRTGDYRRHGSWARYCRDQLGIAHRTANALIAAAQVRKDLRSSCPAIDGLAQNAVLVLHGVDKRKRVAIFGLACKLAGDGKVTRQIVEQAVKEFGAPKPNPVLLAIQDIRQRLNELEAVIRAGCETAPNLFPVDDR